MGRSRERESPAGVNGCNYRVNKILHLDSASITIQVDEASPLVQPKSKKPEGQRILSSSHLMQQTILEIRGYTWAVSRRAKQGPIDQ